MMRVSVRRIGLLIALFIAMTMPSLRAEMPRAAQDAVKNGLAAAQQQDYARAIDLFTEARKTAPNEPELFGYLGLAESRIPGRELRAMAWFGAYLAASPHAPNVAAVKSEIDALDTRSRTAAVRLATAVQDAAFSLRQRQEEAEWYLNEPLFFAASLWALFGDDAKAFKIGAQTSNPIKSWLDVNIASLHWQAEDMAGAKELGRRAQKDIELVDNAEERIMLLVQLAYWQWAAGDTPGGQASLRMADTAMKLSDQKTQDIYQAGLDSRRAELTAPPVPDPAPGITVSDWVKELDAINTPLFLDQTSYLRTVPSNDPQATFYSIRTAASTFINAQRIIEKMLKLQAQPAARP